jgi:hypothetical protein
MMTPRRTPKAIRHKAASLLGAAAESQSVMELLADHTPAVCTVVEALRLLIRQTVSDTSESVYVHWHGIGYTHPQVGYFCAIFPQATTVKLGFEFGVLLPDPDNLLTGGGKQVRYVELRPGVELPEEPIARLLQAAVDLPPSRAARLAMLKNVASRGS